MEPFISRLLLAYIFLYCSTAIDVQTQRKFAKAMCTSLSTSLMLSYLSMPVCYASISNDPSAVDRFNVALTDLKKLGSFIY